LSAPTWLTDIGADVPRRYQDLELQWGPVIRREGLGRGKISEMAGVGETTARALAEYAHNRTPHTPPSLGAGGRAIPMVPAPQRAGMELENPPPPGSHEDVRDLIEHRAKVYARKMARRGDRVRRIRLRDDLPICIANFGDPHVDDDGCDWPRLLKAVETVRDTEGMWAGQVGDLHNNWVGRLASLYEKQSTTREEALKLARWLLHSAPHLYVVAGNHDLWRDSWDMLRAMIGSAPIHVLERYEARIQLQWPNGVTKRIHVRHDFKGRSQWNPAHGMVKAAMLDGWADVYLQGHHHEAAENMLVRHDGTVARVVKVGAFKRMDSYAEQHAFTPCDHGEVAYTIFDPQASRSTEQIRVLWDADEAAAMLQWLRERRRNESS
jgi:hypothetical protein